MEDLLMKTIVRAVRSDASNVHIHFSKYSIPEFGPVLQVNGHIQGKNTSVHEASFDFKEPLCNIDIVANEDAEINHLTRVIDDLLNDAIQKAHLKDEQESKVSELEKLEKWTREKLEASKMDSATSYRVIDTYKEFLDEIEKMKEDSK